MVDLTGANGHDFKSVSPILAQIEPKIEITSFIGDGAYDIRHVCATIQARVSDARIIIPPQKNARIWQHGNCKAAPLPHDENRRAICKNGQQVWKQQSGYHHRSLTETALCSVSKPFLATLF